MLARWFRSRGDEVVILSRRAVPEHGVLAWDGRTLGDWVQAIDGADLVLNLAGRSVDCRYTRSNLDQMMRSRVDSTRIVGQAIAQATQPPPLWLQMSTATIYAHRFDAPNDEQTGVIGGAEPDAPEYWGFSIEIAKAWELEQERADTPDTRKVALRAAMVMSPDRGGIFHVLSRMTRLGLGGPIAGGRQYVSWIHEQDFVRAVDFLIDHKDITGPVNLAAPNPLPQRDFMVALRRAWRTPIGLPAAAWMAEIGAFFLRTDTELLLKSRRVVPGRLLAEGFTFDHPQWPEAAANLVESLSAR